MLATEPCTFHGLFECHRILEPDRTGLRNYVADMTQTSGYPGPLPVSLERGDLAQLESGGWWVAPKTDGVRGLLVCTTYQGLRVCALFDRRLEPYCLSLAGVPTAMFQGTLLDGEVLADRFVAFDALVVSGSAVGAQPLSVRLKAMSRGLLHYRRHAKEIALGVKEFTRDKDYAADFDGADNDGIVLVREDRGVAYGRDFGMFKLKPAGQHTVDFVVGAGGELMVYDPAARQNVGVSAGTVSNTPVGAILECRVRADGSAEFVRDRPDKTRANDMLTYRKTVLNVQENVTTADVRAALKKNVSNT